MSLLEERIEKYIELQEDLEYAEEKASEYRSVQDDYGRCGYNDEDTIYHSCGMTALSYENEMDNIVKSISADVLELQRLMKAQDNTLQFDEQLLQRMVAEAVQKKVDELNLKLKKVHILIQERN